MKLEYGSSKSGNIADAVSGITEPTALFFIVANEEMLAPSAEELANRFPGVPSIGGVGLAYAQRQSSDEGVAVIAMKQDIRVVADVLEEASVMPVKYIKRLVAAFEGVEAEQGDTACFDICSAGADLRAVTTLSSFLRGGGYDLAGGTSNSALVACNGKVYENACAFFAIKNLKGKIKSYKENIYLNIGSKAEQMMVTAADPKNYTICTLDNQPADSLYRNALGINREKMTTQTFKNPFGHICDSDTYIISIKDVDEEGNIVAFRPANKMDFLTILQLGDYREVVRETIAKMHQDLGTVSAVLSVNCLFRYILFHDEHYWDDYLAEMCRDFSHAGLVGVGEHYNAQFVNQTMCCLAFE